VPFLAASKLLARGSLRAKGPADRFPGRGAGFGLPGTSFTEMFCPDWERGSVFLSHMGELNWR